MRCDSFTVLNGLLLYSLQCIGNFGLDFLIGDVLPGGGVLQWQPRIVVHPYSDYRKHNVHFLDDSGNAGEEGIEDWVLFIQLQVEQVETLENGPDQGLAVQPLHLT